MDIGKAVGFVFEDEEWMSKLLLGTVIMLIPIFGWFALMGYAMEVLRRVKADDPRPLPDWDDIGRYFVDGLMFWVATLIYTIPILIVVCPIALIWILPAAAGDSEDLMILLGSISGIVTLGLGCLASLYGILLALLSPVLQIRYAESGELGDCFRFGEIFRFLFANIGSIILSQILIWVVGMIIGTVVSVSVSILLLIPLCGWILAALLGLLMLPVGAWLTIFSGHLYGQIGRQADLSVI